jgi:hypothetical protein
MCSDRANDRHLYRNGQQSKMISFKAGSCHFWQPFSYCLQRDKYEFVSYWYNNVLYINMLTVLAGSETIITPTIRELEVENDLFVNREHIQSLTETQKNWKCYWPFLNFGFFSAIRTLLIEVDALWIPNLCRANLTHVVLVHICGLISTRLVRLWWNLSTQVKVLNVSEQVLVLFMHVFSYFCFRC